jgi:zinc transport system substrate-binding protein
MGKNIVKRTFSPVVPVILLVLLVTSLAAGFIGCNTQESVSDDKIVVSVSILPQIDFVERIGGDKVQVSEMIPPGFSPATYEPSPEQLQELQDAEIYFRIGHVPFEKAQMDNLTSLNPDMKVVDTSAGIDLLEGDDPHIWLSPKLVITQAKHIYDTLVEYSPQNEEYFTQNYDQFVIDLEELDQKLENAFAPIKGQTILVFHPAFGYLADAYGFHQESIEIEGKEPTPAQLQAIIDEAQNADVKVIFVQKQFSTKSAEAVAEAIGGAVVQIDPLAQDYFPNLENMAETIVSALE